MSTRRDGRNNDDKPQSSSRPARQQSAQQESRQTENMTAVSEASQTSPQTTSNADSVQAADFARTDNTQRSRNLSFGLDDSSRILAQLIAAIYTSDDHQLAALVNSIRHAGSADDIASAVRWAATQGSQGDARNSPAYRQLLEQMQSFSNGAVGHENESTSDGAPSTGSQGDPDGQR